MIGREFKDGIPSIAVKISAGIDDQIAGKNVGFAGGRVQRCIGGIVGRWSSKMESAVRP